MATVKNNASKLELAYLELSAHMQCASDAKAVLETSVQVMETGDLPPEVVTARHGMKLLDCAYNGLDAAIGRLPVESHAKVASAAMKAPTDSERKLVPFDDVVRRLVNSPPAPTPKKVKPKRKKSKK